MLRFCHACPLHAVVLRIATYSATHLYGIVELCNNMSIQKHKTRNHVRGGAGLLMMVSGIFFSQSVLSGPLEVLPFSF